MRRHRFESFEGVRYRYTGVKILKETNLVMSNQTAIKPQSAYQALTAKYFIKCSVLRKHFTGNGNSTASPVAEAIIAASTIRVENSNSIHFKSSIDALNSAMVEIGINQPKATLAEVI